MTDYIYELEKELENNVKYVYLLAENPSNEDFHIKASMSLFNFYHLAVLSPIKLSTTLKCPHKDVMWAKHYKKVLNTVLYDNLKSIKDNDLLHFIIFNEIKTIRDNNKGSLLQHIDLQGIIFVP